MVLVDTLAINVRNPFWGADSNTYNPDRFKTIKQTEVSSRGTQRHSGTMLIAMFLSFSCGTICFRLGLDTANAWVNILQRIW
jgi:hypothetical protein